MVFSRNSHPCFGVGRAQVNVRQFEQKQCVSAAMLRSQNQNPGPEAKQIVNPFGFRVRGLGGVGFAMFPNLGLELRGGGGAKHRRVTSNLMTVMKTATLIST